MTVRLVSDGRIMLEGVCPVDDAEPLQQLLIRHPSADVDWSGCEQAHTAVLQVLMAVEPKIRGSARSAFLQDWILPILTRSQA